MESRLRQQDQSNMGRRQRESGEIYGQFCAVNQLEAQTAGFSVKMFKQLNLQGQFPTIVTTLMWKVTPESGQTCLAARKSSKQY